MEYYKIRSHPYVFHAEVHTPRGQPIKVKVGGKLGCVDITIYGNRDKNPYLEGLRSHRDCTPENGMLPSSGTAKLLKAALSFVYQLYPMQHDIQFTDTSFVNCADGKRINVYDLYIVKYLKTWYQDKVNACTVNTSDSNHLQELYTMLQLPYKEATFQEFSSKYLHGRIPSFQLLDLENVLKPIFESNKTYHGFFKEVAEYDCVVFDKWLSNFITTNVQFEMSSVMWYIKKSTVASFPQIEVSKMTEKPLFVQNRRPMDQSYLFQYGGDRHHRGRFEQDML